MNKDHFPVNDKTIADVNKANARAYSSDEQDHDHDSESPRPNLKPKPEEREAAFKAYGMKSGTKKKQVGDHVRESSQEHGEDSKEDKGAQAAAIHKHLTNFHKNLVDPELDDHQITSAAVQHLQKNTPLSHGQAKQAVANYLKKQK